MVTLRRAVLFACAAGIAYASMAALPFAQAQTDASAAVSSAARSEERMKVKEITCKTSRTPDGCIAFLCPGGYRWNTCMQCKMPEKKPQAAPAAVRPTVKGPCADAEAAVREAKAALQQDPANVDLQAKGKSLQAAFEECRQKNFNRQGGADGCLIIPDPENANCYIRSCSNGSKVKTCKKAEKTILEGPGSGSCTYVQIGDCVEKKCDGKLVARSCKNASSSSSGDVR